MAAEDQVAVVYAATNGFVDRIDADRVAEFHQGLVERLHAEVADTLKKIADGDWSDETQKALDDAIAQYAQDFGYDLDEEGHPLTDEQAIREGGRRDRDEDEQREEEPAAA
jgi:F-type H+-transporting ATPase subunit alpha